MAIYHKHHIIPKHMGGSDDSSNLIKLTIEEHAEAHRKLYEEHGNQYDYIAWKSLLKEIGEEEARILAVKHSLTGIPKSEEHKAKISISQKRRYNLYGNPTKGTKKRSATQERKDKISAANKGNKGRLGQKHSEETKQKMRLAALRRYNSTHI